MISYFSIVVTSSIIINHETDDHATVEFSAKSRNGKKAHFLKDIKKKEGSSNVKGQRTFTATKVDIAEVKRFLEEDIAKKEAAVPLFCVHRFNVDPGSAFETMCNQKVIEKVKSYGGGGGAAG